VEPYCIAADIYSNRQHPGRGGWTWYTGSASWAYKTGIENILGFHKEGNKLTITPHVPTDWNEFSIRYRFGNSTYVIKCKAKGDKNPSTTIDLIDDGKEHEVII
jgi:cyclic beta-1,2-glucan synthetase